MPVTLNVVALVKVMVTGCSRFALVGGGPTTAPALMLAAPVLASAAAVRMGAAAAICAPSINATRMSRAPVRVGCSRKVSPFAGVPDARVIVTPSIVCGKLANVLVFPSESRVTE